MQNAPERVRGLPHSHKKVPEEDGARLLWAQVVLGGDEADLLFREFCFCLEPVVEIVAVFPAA